LFVQVAVEEVNLLSVFDFLLTVWWFDGWEGHDIGFDEFLWWWIMFVVFFRFLFRSGTLRDL